MEDRYRNEEQINCLLKVIKNLINQMPIVKNKNATVVSYNDSTKKATVRIAGDLSGNTHAFKNLTGQILQTNDLVILQSSDGSLTNAFIAFKYNV